MQESKASTQQSQLTSLTFDSSEKEASALLKSQQDEEAAIGTNVAGLDLNDDAESLDNETSDSDSYDDIMRGVW